MKMKRKLMIKQETQIVNFMEKRFSVAPSLKLDTNVTKFTIDSVINDKFRLIVSELKEPLLLNSEMLKKKNEDFGKKLANFNLWKRIGSEAVSLKDAFSRIGVKKPDIKEGKVFVRFENETFEITEYVREAVKNHYLPLLKRESYQIKVQER
jgi:hypothetical protein